MRAVLVISERDNVATALEALDPGRRVDVNNTSVVAIEAIPAGHKMALGPIAAGSAIFKYGSPIGTATADIRAGAHVHTHNVASNRGRGDLDPTPVEPAAARLAEPPDEPQTARTH
jgi:altronate dehydratase